MFALRSGRDARLFCAGKRRKLSLRGKKPLSIETWRRDVLGTEIKSDSIACNKKRAHEEGERENFFARFLFGRTFYDINCRETMPNRRRCNYYCCFSFGVWRSPLQPGRSVGGKGAQRPIPDPSAEIFLRHRQKGGEYLAVYVCIARRCLWPRRNKG